MDKNILPSHCVLMQLEQWLESEKPKERECWLLCPTFFSGSEHRHGQRCPLGLHRGVKCLNKKPVGLHLSILESRAKAQKCMSKRYSYCISEFIPYTLWQTTPSLKRKQQQANSVSSQLETVEAWKLLGNNNYLVDPSYCITKSGTREQNCTFFLMAPS